MPLYRLRFCEGSTSSCCLLLQRCFLCVVGLDCGSFFQKRRIDIGDGASGSDATGSNAVAVDSNRSEEVEGGGASALLCAWIARVAVCLAAGLCSCFLPFAVAAVLGLALAVVERL